MNKKVPKMTSGIYTITNLVNGKMYVGHSNDIRWRFYKHKYELRAGIMHSSHLQNAWNEYGEESFEFDILEEYSEELLVAMEHYWCNVLNTHNREFGYNIKPTHPNEKYTNQSEESKIKISNAFKQAIVMLDSSGKYIREFLCPDEAAEIMGFNPERIRATMRGTQKFHKNFIFIKASEYNVGIDYNRVREYGRKGRKIVCTNTETGETKKYSSVRQLAEEKGIKTLSYIYRVIHGVRSHWKSYKFMYED